jgi:signal peptidase II
MARPFAHTLLSPAAVARFVITTAVGLGLDLWTKSLAVAKLSPDPSNPFERPPVYVAIRGWLQFEYVSNPGAVFGIAPGHRMIFLGVSVLAIGFLTYLFSGSAKRPVYQIILGLLLAGVLGNLYDRIVYSRVRDMIHALPGWTWPHSIHDKLTFLPNEVFPYIFNVADSLLCVGVVLMLIYSFFNAPDEKPRRSSASTAAASA